MTEEEKANIKYRLSDIGKQVGDLALEYIAGLEKEIEQLKAYESHWDEIEEDAKIIAEENAELKEKMGRAGYRIAELELQIEKMKCCRNCLYEYNDEELVKEMKNNQCPCTDCKKLNYKNWRLYK